MFAEPSKYAMKIDVRYSAVTRVTPETRADAARHVSRQVLEDGKFNFEMMLPKTIAGGGSITPAYRAAQLANATLPAGACTRLEGM